ncbi:acetyltransferase [Pilimelia anulata]|uniref:Acetyltransferase n=1 Tax=Pilimelia anulata TaxID=53371 RepID=A0A8J3FBJ1_9ACTN|nr:GNAT family N-acetyltransferase [Pilimelia anulata]GGK01944.1 acetyltransferase [Pilimelia anulata]
MATPGPAAGRPADGTAAVVPAGALAGVPQPRLYAGDLLLRPFAPADAPVLVAAFADPHIAYWNLEAAMTPAAAAARIADYAAQLAAERAVNWLVADAASGEPRGRVSLSEVSLWYGGAEATYWTLPGARGRGVASTALRAAARWGLDRLGLGRVHLRHSVGNAGSCRVAGRAGFVAEGTHRHALRHADGWHDMHVHSLVATDPAG